MSCPGLHCACCSGGSAVPVAILAGALGVDWVLTHLVEVAAVAGTSGALAVAASVALLRWADLRDSRRAELWAVRVVSHSAVTGMRPPAWNVTAACDSDVSSAERPAIVYRDLHIHLDGIPAAEQADVIRRALGGGNEIRALTLTTGAYQGGYARRL
jgi:hypothetical protein